MVVYDPVRPRPPYAYRMTAAPSPSFHHAVVRSSLSRPPTLSMLADGVICSIVATVQFYSTGSVFVLLPCQLYWLVIGFETFVGISGCRIVRLFSCVLYACLLSTLSVETILGNTFLLLIIRLPSSE